jgi:hypothetical protein
MQTVVNLDPDVDALLKQEARNRNLDFDRVLNEATRAGFSSRATDKPQRFVQKTYPLGAQADVTKALALSDDLEDEETIRKLRDAERRQNLLSLECSLSEEEGKELRSVVREHPENPWRPAFIWPPVGRSSGVLRAR